MLTLQSIPLMLLMLCGTTISMPMPTPSPSSSIGTGSMRGAKISMPTPSPSMGTAPMRVSTNHLAQVQDVANKYQSARHECMKEEGTAEDSVARYEDTEDIGSDLGCFAGCVGYKMGAIHEGGGFNEKNWADHVSQIDDAEERRRLWYEGSIMSHSVNGMNRCDTGNKLARLSKEFSKPPKEQHLPSVQ